MEVKEAENIESGLKKLTQVRNKKRKEEKGKTVDLSSFGVKTPNTYCQADVKYCGIFLSVCLALFVLGSNEASSHR